MAFVYCNDRWKNNKQNNFPGPCEYGGEQESSCQLSQHAASRLLKSMKKVKYQRKIPEKDAQQAFKEMINQRMLPVYENGKNNQAKKGKLYRNHSMEMKNTKQKVVQQQTELKMIIKNALRSQSNIGVRNKWGNVRIKEMLNQHRQKQLKKSTMQLYNKQNRTVLIKGNKQKLKEDLRQLQAILTTQRKGGNANLQNVNKKKIMPVSKFLPRANSEHQIRFSQPSKEDLQVQPSTVYVSDKYNYDHEFYTQPEHSFGHGIPNSSMKGSSKLGSKQKSLPTGLQDDTYDEDSMQYISDATPGPGSYNIDCELSKVGTKIEKFGVTMERFKPQKVPLTHALIAPLIPQYKVSTNARQEDVGFGRSTKQTKDKTNIAHNGRFYEDYESLEYKSLKNKQKNRKENLCFESGQQRFRQEVKKNLSIESDSEQQQEEEKEQIETEVKPTSIFLSKVNRQLDYAIKTTQKADFTGQNYNCIANKLIKQKQHFEDYDLEPAPFLSTSKRFVYKEVKSEEKKEELLGIKIQQLRKRKEIKRRYEEKGFTFCKDTKKDFISAKRSQEMPSPDHYQKSPTWIKQSYNVRFNP